MPGIDSRTDFVELASRIRTQSKAAAGSDADRVTIRSFDAVDTEALSTLLQTTEGAIAVSTDLVFVLSRANLERLLERDHDIDDRETLEDRLGRPVQAEDEMPDDTFLLLDPDAVDGATPVEPAAIACGIVGTDR